MTDGETIKTIRTGLKLTQEQFADALGVTFVTVSSWETGKAVPRENTWRALAGLCAAFFVSINGTDERRDEIKAMAGRINAIRAARDREERQREKTAAAATAAPRSRSMKRKRPE